MAGIDFSDVNLPYNLDAEQAVLGSIIVDSSVIAQLSSKLTPSSFHVQLHSDIFAVMLQMFATGAVMDIVTILEAVMRRNIFDNTDEAKIYLTKLARLAISPSTVDIYAKIIEEKFMTRQLMTASKEIFDLAAAGTEETQYLLDFAEKKIYDIRSDKEISGLTHIKPIILQKIQELSQISENPDSEKKNGLSTSFSMLDKYIYGLNKSDLILIAARPGMGKTAFAVNIATNVAMRNRDKKVCIFNLEMSKEQIAGRILSSQAHVTSEQMRTGRIERDGWKNLGEACDVLSQTEIYIDDSSTVSIGEIKAKLRRVNNLGLVVIDYLQLMSTGRRDGNRVSEISEITRNLKILAKELDVPVITLSQLSRGPEQRPDKRPMLSDLRESGSIEQDADIVLFLYRGGYYNPDDEHPNDCECIVAKNRHGETGTVHLNWEGQYTLFTTAENYREVPEY